MNNQLVSVVIPAYKCAGTISSAIESVLTQTYKDVELIVVDDGSPDDTFKVAEKYKDRIIYIHQENGGVSKARNTGINNSKGSYVAFLDADDRWDEKKIEIQMEIFKRHPEVGLVFSEFWNTKNGKIIESRNYMDSFNFFKEYSYDINDIFENKSQMDRDGHSVDYRWGNIYDSLFLGNFILPSSVIAKKSSLLEAGLFNENIKVAEETEYFLKYSSMNAIGFVSKPLVYYEIPSSGNLSGKSNSVQLMKNALKIQIDSFISNRNKRKTPTRHYLKGIGTTYNRLAYYYVSEYNNLYARKYAVYGMKTFPYNIKSYLIWLMSFAPKRALGCASKIKRLKRI